MDLFYDSLEMNCKNCGYEFFSAKDISVCDDIKIEFELICPHCRKKLSALITRNVDRTNMAQSLGM